LSEENRPVSAISIGSFNRIPHVPVSRKNCLYILDPFPIIGMGQPVNVRKHVRIVAV
jgi:hypothetical protein